jgi:hypothetical protein
MNISFRMMPCEQCGQTVRIPRHRWDTFRFCSRACGWAWRNEHERIAKTCAECGNAFDVIRVREKTARYCSRKCYGKALSRMGSVEFTCDFCDQPFLSAPSRVGKRRYCSSECAHLAGRKTEFTLSTYRKGALKQLPAVCAHCGYSDHPEILVIHHTNGRKDHTLRSLKVLCPNCHALEHHGKT